MDQEVELKSLVKECIDKADAEIKKKNDAI